MRQCATIAWKRCDETPVIHWQCTCRRKPRTMLNQSQFTPAQAAMTNTSKSRKRCPACGSSNPMDAWECEMCGTSFGDVKPPRSLQQEQAKPPASAPTPAAQPKPAQPKTTPTKTTPAAKPQTQSANGKSAAKPAAAFAKTPTETFNAPIKNAGSMKKPAPLYASKPRFGLGSLVALVFVAAFGIAAIVFGMNALSGNAPAAAPAQPTLFVSGKTSTLMPLATTANDAQMATPAAIEAPTSLPTELPTEAPTDAPIEVPAVVPTVAPPAAATTEPTIAPSPTSAGKPTATPRPTQTPAATSAPLGTGETITYTVKGGDTCGAISKRLGVSVAQIIQQNKLDERCFLNVGKVLTITK